MLLFLCQSIVAQNKTPTNDSPSQTDLGIFALPPFERAVRCIKYYEGDGDRSVRSSGGRSASGAVRADARSGRGRGRTCREVPVGAEMTV